MKNESEQSSAAVCGGMCGRSEVYDGFVQCR